MTTGNEQTFWFDSSDLGTGAFEVRVCGRYEHGHLDLWTRDSEKTVYFTDLSERDKTQVQEILGLTWDQRMRLAHNELRLLGFSRLLNALKDATQHLTDLGANTKHYEQVILNAERKAK